MAPSHLMHIHKHSQTEVASTLRTFRSLELWTLLNTLYKTDVLPFFFCSISTQFFKHILPEMPFTKAIGDYLYQNSTRISKLFNLKEQTDFLLKFVSQTEIDKFLSAGIANADHVKKMIRFIQYEEDDLLYEALIKQLLQTDTQNGEFVSEMMKTCRQAADRKAGDNNS